MAGLQKREWPWSVTDRQGWGGNACVWVYGIVGYGSGECSVSVCICADNRIKRLLIRRHKSNGGRRGEGRRKRGGRRELCSTLL